MDTIVKLINNCFENKLCGDASKKEIKKLGQSLKSDDINYLIKTSFDIFRKHIGLGNDLFLTDCLENICNSLNSLRIDEKHSSPAVPEVFFASVDDCSQRLMEFINSAREVLLICMFTISDDRLSQHVAKQHRKGVKVKIITDNEKQFDAGSDAMRLAESGIEVRIDKTDHHMHHKFAISDNKSLLTGSYNWTRSAADFNEENFLILSDNYAIEKYKKEFERLWRISVDISQF